jgi:benzoate/toluate 1,2-dioxygenase alpha subunit
MKEHAMTENLIHAREVLADAVIDDRENGIIRAKREIFTDQEIFELEMKHIFEGNWVYLAHESQIPNVGDYFTTYIGRTPVMITRDKDEKLNCIVNACSHRGAMLCRRKTDNRTTFTCPFHGWTFKNSGELLKVKDSRNAGYPETFNKEGSHDLTKVARFESYRGFLFGSLKADVLPLEEHLGDATKVIDSIVDQSPEGLEVLRGSSTYTYDGNWKVQAENGADGYHVTAVHIGTTQPPRPAAAPVTPRPRPRPWTPANGARPRAASTPTTTGTCCCGRNGPTPRTARSGTAATNWSRSTARRWPTS